MKNKWVSAFGLLPLVLLIAAISYGEDQALPLSGSWNVPNEAARVTNPVRYDVESVSAGKALFDIHCQSCHGYYAEGTGIEGASLNQIPANLLRLSGKQSEGAFAWKIAEGRGEMPSFRGKLTELEIWYLVNFIASLENEPGSLGGANY